MKIVYGGETKRVPDIKVYAELLQHSIEVFRVKDSVAQIGNLMRFYNMDEEGDLITVSCQDDLDVAMK